MGANEFVDYYELLQVSPNADADTIERVFRHLAKKFHPDNPEFADHDRFHQIVEAHLTLTNSETRAGYDVKYQNYWDRKWGLASEASSGSAYGDDKATRERLLALLYVQRRRNVRNPGMGEYEAARLLGIPLELVEFHIWYLRGKSWVERLQSGHLAITTLGVDQVEQGRLRLNPDHLLEATASASDNVEPAGNMDDKLLAAE